MNIKDLQNEKSNAEEKIKKCIIEELNYLEAKYNVNPYVKASQRKNIDYNTGDFQRIINVNIEIKI